MWQHQVKNVLLIIWTASLLLTGPTVTLLGQEEMRAGLLMLIISVLSGTTSLYVMVHWPNRKTFATPLGLVAALIFFVIGTIWLELNGFNFWIPTILLLITFLIARGITPSKQTG